MQELLLSRVELARLSETIADETIIINLEDGHYFRVRGMASTMWEAMAAPVTVESVLALVPAGSGTSVGAVARYLLQLESAKLIAIDEAVKTGLAAAAAEAPVSAACELALETYDDMADLLLLDPVHDVGEQGWPARMPADL